MGKFPLTLSLPPHTNGGSLKIYSDKSISVLVFDKDFTTAARLCQGFFRTFGSLLFVFCDFSVEKEIKYSYRVNFGITSLGYGAQAVSRKYFSKDIYHFRKIMKKFVLLVLRV